jgi:hypothetical protein
MEKFVENCEKWKVPGASIDHTQIPNFQFSTLPRQLATRNEQWQLKWSPSVNEAEINRHFSIDFSIYFCLIDLEA